MSRSLDAWRVVCAQLEGTGTIPPSQRLSPLQWVIPLLVSGGGGGPGIMQGSFCSRASQRSISQAVWEGRVYLGFTGFRANTYFLFLFFFF